MDPRIKTLIEGVRRTHIPLTWLHEDLKAYCTGCEGLEYVCPALKAAKELEDEESG
jgi:hypothetical protein